MMLHQKRFFRNVLALRRLLIALLVTESNAQLNRNLFSLVQFWMALRPRTKKGGQRRLGESNSLIKFQAVFTQLLGRRFRRRQPSATEPHLQLLQE